MGNLTKQESEELIKMVHDVYEIMCKYYKDKCDAIVNPLKDAYLAVCAGHHAEYTVACKPYEDAYKAACKPYVDNYRNKTKPFREALIAAIEPIWDKYDTEIDQYWTDHVAGINRFRCVVKCVTDPYDLTCGVHYAVYDDICKPYTDKLNEALKPHRDKYRTMCEPYGHLLSGCKPHFDALLLACAPYLQKCERYSKVEDDKYRALVVPCWNARDAAILQATLDRDAVLAAIEAEDKMNQTKQDVCKVYAAESKQCVDKNIEYDSHKKERESEYDRIWLDNSWCEPLPPDGIDYKLTPGMENRIRLALSGNWQTADAIGKKAGVTNIKAVGQFIRSCIRSLGIDMMVQGDCRFHRENSHFIMYRTSELSQEKRGLSEMVLAIMKKSTQPMTINEIRKIALDAVNVSLEQILFNGVGTRYDITEIDGTPKFSKSTDKYSNLA